MKNLEQKATSIVEQAMENGISTVETMLSTYKIKYHWSIDKFTFFNTLHGGAGEYWEKEELIEKLQTSDFAKYL